MIEGLEKFNIFLLWANLQLWVYDNVMNWDTIYQFIVIISSFIFASILFKILDKKQIFNLEKYKIPDQLRRPLHHSKKLIIPIIALIAIFTMSSVIADKQPDMNLGFVRVISKVLWAWVFIRLSVLFIDNSAVRNVFSLTIWIIAALSIFGVLDETTNTLNSIGINLGTFRLSALVLIKGAIYLFATLYLAIFISKFVEKRVLKSHSFSRSSQVLLSKIIRIVLIIVAIIIGLTSSGIDMSLFAVFGGAIGLGIGLGLQRGVANLFSGMMLLADRSIQPGDVIELDNGTYGQVKNMGGRCTEIITRDNKSYLIPNEEFINSRVVNWSRGSARIRISVEFGVHYDSNPHDVMRVAIAATQNVPRVLKDEQSVCWITEFADSSINFSLRFWIKDPYNGLANVQGEVLLALWDAFKENGIAIPYPHREIFMHTQEHKIGEK